jgi:NDP-sugar pyrophosphorylase family protein
MTAVILAAGYGSRLRPLTDNIPKTMVVVAGERIIDRIIESLQLASVFSAVVVLGYRGDELRGYLEAKYAGSMRFVFLENKEYASTNT